MHVLQHRCIHQNSMQQHALQEVHLHYSTVQYCTIHYTGKHCPQHVPPACLQGAVDEASDHEACLLGSCPAAHQWMGCSKKMRTTVLQPTFWICNVLQYITVQYSTVFCKDAVHYFTVLYSTGNNSEYSAVRFTTGKAVLCLRIVWGRLKLVHWILPNGRRLIVLVHILSAWWLRSLQ